MLLKGNVTVIAEPGSAQPVYLNPAGQSWAATAGSGDVLSGVIGALLAAGLPPGEAAAIGGVRARPRRRAVGRRSRTTARTDVGVGNPRPHPFVDRQSLEGTPDVTQAHSGSIDRSCLHRQALHRARPDAAHAEESMDPQAAYRFIHDELMLDGSSRLNLATFVTTWMDPEAEKLMAETFDKNMIDKDEYPATAAIEQRCVCMVADLFHAENLRDDDPPAPSASPRSGPARR